VHSDSPDGIQRLNQEAAKAMAAGRRAGIDVTYEKAIRWITINPARALGIDSQTGSLEPGKRADLIIVVPSGPNALPLYHPYSYLVYSARADAVETVVVDGKILMERRRMLTLDTEAIRRHAERYRKKIAAALPD